MSSKGVLFAVCIFCAGFAYAQDDSGKRVLATYGDQQITVAQFAEQQPGIISWLGIGTGPDQIKTALEDSIFEAVVSKEALSGGLMKEPDVQAQINKILLTAYMRRHVPQDTIQVQESEVSEYYEKNKEKYKDQEQYKVSHLLVKSEEEAKKISEGLKKGQGQKWETIVSQRSLDVGTAKNAGSVGLIPPNSLLPQIREAAKSLQPGQVSDVVKTAFGYHLVRLEEKPTVKYRPLEELKKDIYQELFRAKKQDLMKNVKADLWKKYNVAIKDSTISELVKEKSAANAQVDLSSVERAKRQPGEATELQVIAETMELGKIAPKKYTHTLLMANASGKEIEIQRVGSTCKCISVSVDSTKIAPGKMGKLTLNYDPEMFKEKGRLEKLLYVESNDTIEPRKFIRLYFDIDRT